MASWWERKQEAEVPHRTHKPWRGKQGRLGGGDVSISDCQCYSARQLSPGWWLCREQRAATGPEGSSAVHVLGNTRQMQTEAARWEQEKTPGNKTARKSLKRKCDRLTPHWMCPRQGLSRVVLFFVVLAQLYKTYRPCFRDTCFKPWGVTTCRAVSLQLKIPSLEYKGFVFVKGHTAQEPQRKHSYKMMTTFWKQSPHWV